MKTSIFSIIAKLPGFDCFCSNDLYLSLDEVLTGNYIVDGYMYNIGNGIRFAEIWKSKETKQTL
jgi:hypothetical protein